MRVRALDDVARQLGCDGRVAGRGPRPNAVLRDAPDALDLGDVYDGSRRAARRGVRADGEGADVVVRVRALHDVARQILEAPCERRHDQLETAYLDEASALGFVAGLGHGLGVRACSRVVGCVAFEKS